MKAEPPERTLPGFETEAEPPERTLPGFETEAAPPFETEVGRSLIANLGSIGRLQGSFGV